MEVHGIGNIVVIRNKVCGGEDRSEVSAAACLDAGYVTEIAHQPLSTSGVLTRGLALRLRHLSDIRAG